MKGFKQYIDKSFIIDIETETIKNDNFRKVLNTSENLQLVVMSIPVGQDIGEETHKDVDQFIRIEKGEGEFVLNGKGRKVNDGFCTIIPMGTKHNVVNVGDEPLKLYAIYSPAEHAPDTLEKNKPVV